MPWAVSQSNPAITCLLGGRDGVIIIPQQIAEAVIAKAEEVVSTENLVRKAIVHGVLPLDAYNRYGRF